MTNEELKPLIDALETRLNEALNNFSVIQKENRDLKTQVDDLNAKITRDSFQSVNQNFKSYTIIPTRNITIQSDEVNRGEVIFFPTISASANFKIYQEENGGDLFIASQTLNGPQIRIAESSYITLRGYDEANLRCDDGTNNTYLYIDTTKARFYTNGTNLFRLGLPNLASTPASGAIGDLCVVGGKLYICTATTPTWVVVGTQS